MNPTMIMTAGRKQRTEWPRSDGVCATVCHGWQGGGSTSDHPRIVLPHHAVSERYMRPSGDKRRDSARFGFQQSATGDADELFSRDSYSTRPTWHMGALSTHGA
jgi:hypothetical protein